MLKILFVWLESALRAAWNLVERCITTVRKSFLRERAFPRMRGHYACLPACLPLVPSYLAGITWEKTTKKKKEEKKGASKQIFTLSKALGNSKDAPQDWRKKSLFSCLSCLTCTAHAPALRPSPLPITCHMRLPHRLLLVYAILRHTCFEPLAWDFTKRTKQKV